MRKLFATLCGLALGCTAALAYEPAIDTVKVFVHLLKNGTAEIQEDWDVVVASGTEWYLVRNNLDGSVISNLAVLGDNGQMFIDEGDWDIDRSIKQKEGRSGIVRKANGCELCWGVGSYGPHHFTARYTLSAAVRALEDYDYFHWQLVSPGLSACPDYVRVTIAGEPGIQIDTATTRAWGFGFHGTVGWYVNSDSNEGYVIYESSEPFVPSSSVIALMRFEKGLFEPELTDPGVFQTRLDKALEGASFADDKDEDDDDDSAIGFIAFIVTILLLWGAFKRKEKKVTYLERKQILGQKPDDVIWCRELPYQGNLYETEFTMKKLGEINGSSTLAAALILRMIYKGQLEASRNAEGKLEIRFGTKVGNIQDSGAQQLFNMLREASGSDHILQEKEFKNWSSSSSNQQKITKWSKLCEDMATDKLVGSNSYLSGKFTEKGQRHARECYGFKKFLSDFTLIKEKGTVEVTLWQEYLVYAALFGMSERVAKELKEINTEVADQVLMTGTDTGSMYDLIRMTNVISRSITNAHTAQAYATGSFGGGSRGGFGGHSSFGGGGGFHGGGGGGGSR